MSFLEQYKKTSVLLGESISKVFEYVHKKDQNKKIAVKVIECLNNEGDPQMEAKFEEAIVEAFHNYCCCLHPAIVKCHGIQKKLEFDKQGKLMKINILIALDKMKENLSSEFKTKCKSNTNYTKEEIQKIMASTISGLYYLENLKPPLAHRDIKLANLFVDDNGNILIGDIGSAKEIHLTSVLEEENKEDLVATASFASPEVDKAFKSREGGIGSLENASIDWFKSDVFSLGMCFLMLMSLNKPQINPKDVNTWSLKRDFIEKFLPEIHVKYDEEIQEFLAIMLREDPKDRPTFKGLVDILNGDKKFNDLNKKINKCSEIFTKRSITDFYSKTPVSLKMNSFLSNNRPRCKFHNIEISSLCFKCKEEKEEKMFLCYLCLANHNQDHLSKSFIEDFFVFLSPTNLEKDYYMFLNELEEGLSLFDAMSRSFMEDLKNLQLSDEKLKYLLCDDAGSLRKNKRENVLALKNTMKIKKDQILKILEQFVELEPEETDFDENFQNSLRKIMGLMWEYRLFKENQTKNIHEIIQNYSYSIQNTINETIMKDKQYSKEYFEKSKEKTYYEMDNLRKELKYAHETIDRLKCDLNNQNKSDDCQKQLTKCNQVIEELKSELNKSQKLCDKYFSIVVESYLKSVKVPTLEELRPKLIIDFNYEVMLLTGQSLKNIFKNYREYIKIDLIRFFIQQRQNRRKIMSNEQNYINEYLKFFLGLKSILFDTMGQTFIDFITLSNEILSVSLMNLSEEERVKCFFENVLEIYKWMFEFYNNKLSPEEIIEIKKKSLEILDNKKEFLKNVVVLVRTEVMNLFGCFSLENWPEGYLNLSLMILKMIFSDLVFGCQDLENQDGLFEILGLNSNDACILNIIV